MVLSYTDAFSFPKESKNKYMYYSFNLFNSSEKEDIFHLSKRANYLNKYLNTGINIVLGARGVKWLFS